MNQRLLTIVAMAAALIGCAARPDLHAKQAAFSATIPTCSGTDECTAKWEAAQLWVVRNAGWKIQTQSTVLIETYNAVNSSPRIAVQVVKEPMGGGKYRLIVKVWCDNIFGCQPDSWEAALNFNREIGAVTP